MGLDSLRTALGNTGVLTDLADMGKYLADLQGVTAEPPVAVLRPASTEEVAQAVRWCAAQGHAIIPQGGLTGLTGAAVPRAAGAVVISLERMREIRSIDTANLSVTVEAGVVLAQLHAAVADHGLAFPLHHGGEGSSQIGGNIATNAGGHNALRFGTMRDQVLGLEVVLPDGKVWNGLRGLCKNTAGYDLKQLFIGSEGTLGLITAAVLRLHPAPRSRATALVAVATPQHALTLLRAMQGQMDESLSAFELMSAGALDFAGVGRDRDHPLGTPGPWTVLIEVDSSAPDADLEAALLLVLETAIDSGSVTDATVAQSAAQRDQLWELREAIAMGFVANPSALKCDTAVPVAVVPDCLAATLEALERALPGVRPVPFGHLGDGNIHINVARPEAMAAEDFTHHHGTLAGIVETQALAHGGTISAEHGIGSLKRDRFAATADPVTLALIRQLRATLDPDGRMNPGVLSD